MMFKINSLTIAMLLSGLLVGCNGVSPSNAVIDNTNGNIDINPNAISAPSIPVEVQANYRPAAPLLAHSRAEKPENWDFMVQKNKANIENYHKVANQYPGDEAAYPNFLSLNEYIPATTYDVIGTIVKYTDGSGRTGIFSSKWWTQEAPNMDSLWGAWNLVVRTDDKGNYQTEAQLVIAWDPAIEYQIGAKVKHAIEGSEYFFEAKYWTKNNAPVLTVSSGGTVEDWDSAWIKIDALSDELVKPTPEGEITAPPVCTENCDNIELPDGTPTVPPVIPLVPVEPNPDVSPSLPTIPDLGADDLPVEGYAFLRELTVEHWNWLFPLRSGKFNVAGSDRNKPPYADEDGSTDVFTLKAFKEAVVEYNTWAGANGYKTFLNEGSKSQQAAEFVTFWAKSSRETSGSWENAPAPWIENDQDAGIVWKGGLYWIEEQGYSTDDTGVSTAINYVDAASSFRPEPGRSYYGRGIIQLSWNYNYGAFSSWLHDNGMMREVITERAMLLKRPDLVATNGKLSVLSGIWFWMTPQGAKPSSHDVMYGDVVNVSTTSQEQGLPQRNDNGEILVAAGESQDQAVMAYRLGTVINIVNGGLECNKASSWHSGPVQRVSYYNAFAKYMNANVVGITVPVIEAATNVWTTRISDISDDNLKTATCYAQKSYYSW